jgi:hypothetical protein
MVTSTDPPPPPAHLAGTVLLCQWVYVIGGSSSVGKTTAAAATAEHLGAMHLQLDTIAQASQDPRVRRFETGVDALWSLPAAHQHTVAATNWLYGHWLRQQAHGSGQPWVESRPWETLPDRLIQAWRRPTPDQRPATATT